MWFEASRSSHRKRMSDGGCGGEAGKRNVNRQMNKLGPDVVGEVCTEMNLNKLHVYTNTYSSCCISWTLAAGFNLNLNPGSDARNPSEIIEQNRGLCPKSSGNIHNQSHRMKQTQTNRERREGLDCVDGRMRSVLMNAEGRRRSHAWINMQSTLSSHARVSTRKQLLVVNWATTVRHHYLLCWRHGATATAWQRVTK